jgi:hypothetical protein
MKGNTKYWQNLATSIVIVESMLFSITAEAETIFYEQSPGHFGGFFSDGQDITVADEFQLDQSALIRNISWWGGYGSTVDFPPPVADDFTIRLFTDDGGIPGALVRTFHVGNNANRVATRDFVNPPDLGDPNNPDDDYPGRAEFKYSFNLPKPFPADANTRYWLSITNVPSSDSWVWEVSDSLINLGVQRSFDDPVFGPWEPASVNTAFQLKTDRIRRPKYCPAQFVFSNTRCEGLLGTEIPGCCGIGITE